jgi:hypothetical protein
MKTRKTTGPSYRNHSIEGERMARRPTEEGAVIEIDRVPDTPIPKLLVTHGRGGTGKSTCVRILAERAQAAGRSVVIADADRTNATLASFFSDVVRPDHPDDKTVTDWLDALVNQQAELMATVLLDMGGGDQVFKRFAQSIELVTLLDQVGIMPVALHCIGPDIDDLSYLRDIEESLAFCPTQTILVLNEGLIKDGRLGEAAFTEVRADPVYLAALKRGAVELVLPRLACMQEIVTRRLSFAAAEKTLTLTNKHRVSIWRRDVDKAIAPISHWLP